MEKENVLFVEEKKTEKEKFGEGKYIFLRRRRKTEKEKEGNILRTQIIFLWRRRTEKENIWRRKMLP